MNYDELLNINRMIYFIYSQVNGGSMSPTLYLQAENSKENKNGFLMMFIAWLIKETIFKKVLFFFKTICMNYLCSSK